MELTLKTNGFDLMDTFGLVNHVYKSYQGICSGLWLRSFFIVAAFSVTRLYSPEAFKNFMADIRMSLRNTRGQSM